MSGYRVFAPGRVPHGGLIRRVCCATRAGMDQPFYHRLCYEHARSCLVCKSPSGTAAVPGLNLILQQRGADMADLPGGASGIPVYEELGQGKNARQREQAPRRLADRDQPRDAGGDFGA
jgi:hypothetical protein